MERYTTWRGLGTYSADASLIRDVAGYIHTTIPGILQSGSPHSRNLQSTPVPPLSDHASLTIIGSDNSNTYTPIGQFGDKLFPNDIQLLTIEVNYIDAPQPGASMEPANTRALVLLLKLGQTQGDTELSIALNDNGAREKGKAIEDGLLNVLAKYKNRNRITYPNDFVPTLVFVAGFLIGLGGLMFTDQLLKFLCALLFGIAIYFVAHRFTQGYCSFESNRQRRLNAVLHWITGAVAVFVLGVLLSPLLK